MDFTILSQLYAQVVGSEPTEIIEHQLLGLTVDISDY